VKLLKIATRLDCHSAGLRGCTKELNTSHLIVAPLYLSTTTFKIISTNPRKYTKIGIYI